MSGGQSFCSVRADRGSQATTPGFVDVYVENLGFGGTELEPDGAGGPAIVLGGLGPIFVRQLGIDAGYGAAASTIRQHALTLDLPVGTVSLLVNSASQELPAPDFGVPVTTGATSNLSVNLTGNITLTSTPSIAPPTFDGQLLLIKNESNGSGGTLTLQDQTVLPGSGLSLHGGINQAIPWKGAMLLYGRVTGASGIWVQIGAAP